MADTAGIEEAIKTVLTEKFEVEESKINPAARLQEDLGVDPLAGNELIKAVADRLGIEVPGWQGEVVTTVSQLIATLRPKVNDGDED